MGGLEPPRPKATDFESVMSTNSITLALLFLLKLRCKNIAQSFAYMPQQEPHYSAVRGAYKYFFYFYGIIEVNWLFIIQGNAGWGGVHLCINRSDENTQIIVILRLLLVWQTIRFPKRQLVWSECCCEEKRCCRDKRRKPR